MAFLITRDLIMRKDEEGYGFGVQGPSDAQQDTLDRLAAGEGRAFRMLDDDGVVYYHGRMLEDDREQTWDATEWEFQPLFCYGTPNAGAVTIQYRDESGAWRSI